MQYVSEVGVNSYARVKLSFLSKEVSKCTFVMMIEGFDNDVEFSENCFYVKKTFLSNMKSSNHYTFQKLINLLFRISR